MQVAEYLTAEFYAENYSISHRLLMLDALEGGIKVSLDALFSPKNLGFLILPT
jgi:hypothetical protein